MAKKREYRFAETLKTLLARHPVTGKRVTYTELAEAIGIRQQTVSLYASGETAPSAKHLLEIADFFGVSTDYLLSGHEDNELYRTMVDAEHQRIQEKLSEIAVLCSNAENAALSMMDSED